MPPELGAGRRHAYLGGCEAQSDDEGVKGVVRGALLRERGAIVLALEESKEAFELTLVERKVCGVSSVSDKGSMVP